MFVRLGWKSLQGEKQYSLLRKFVNHGLEKFYIIGPGPKIIERNFYAWMHFCRINPIGLTFILDWLRETFFNELLVGTKREKVYIKTI